MWELENDESYIFTKNINSISYEDSEYRIVNCTADQNRNVISGILFYGIGSQDIPDCTRLTRLPRLTILLDDEWRLINHE